MSGTEELIGRWLNFSEFTPELLYDVLKLRVDVFVVEQACAYPEIDGRDQEALHYVLSDRETGALAGYLRLFADQADKVSIGRVIVADGYRGRGIGDKIMQAGLAMADLKAPGATVHVAGQAYLQSFYEGLGFRTVSAVYLEDGIPHLDMEKP